MQTVRVKEVALISSLWLAVMCPIAPVLAGDGESGLSASDYLAGFDPAAVPEGHDLLEAKAAYMVEQAGTLVTPDGETLLPPGTTLDGLRFDPAGVAHVTLTLARGTPLPIMPESHAAAIDAAFRALLSEASQLAGLSIQIRETLESGFGEYRSLGSLVLSAPAVAEEESSPDQPLAQLRLLRQAAKAGTLMPGPQALGGPVTNVDGLPAGALSGVVVFCAAGHGWTVNNAETGWVLQRPLLFSMNEDYGNLDQLNYFVHYAYNAGAIVVPFRPVGYQNIEIVLDNDDPGVTFTGSWNNSVTNSKYYENGATVSGVPYRWTNSSPTETAVARYTPNIPKSDFYPVYCFTKHDEDRVPQTYRIHHSGGTAQVVVDHLRVGNGWIWLGNYYFEQGTGGYVEISNQSPVPGSIIADAIRFGNGMGSVVGAGSSGLSGWPRDEEAARYWAESELGYYAVGYSSSIWNCCSIDIDDNVGTAARWAREMNRLADPGDLTTDRWRRVYVEFHTNATGGGAKGTIALYNEGSAGTTHQLAFATLMGEKVEADMLALDDGFEYPWGQRNPNTYHASFAYGAISTAANGNEMDATLLEVAFHDNLEDAANLRNVKVRAAVARSATHSLIDFLSDSSRYPGTQVQPVYPPDPPEQVQAVQDGHGNVVVSWAAGPSRPESPASGDPATGFKIYRSSNGYGFGNAVTVGNVTSATLNDLPVDTTVYLRVTAINAGGESMPSSTLAVRRPLAGPARVLIVDGYDRVSRFQNVIYQIPAGHIERPIARRVNSFDYTVQHAMALDAAGRSFDSCVNEAVINGKVLLSQYVAVVWILGEESTDDRTFDSIEQGLVTAYLSAGGRLFVTGSEIGYELDGNNAGRSFYENVLGADYVADGSGTYAIASSSGILAGVGGFDFSPSSGAPYDVNSADIIAPRPGATTILTYGGRNGGTAGIQYDAGTYRVVLFGFPFETISSEPVRNEIMLRVMDWIAPAVPVCLPKVDFDCDGDVDQSDFGRFQVCLTGTGHAQPDLDCYNARLDNDSDVDGADVSLFLNCLTGEGIPADPDCVGG